MRTTWTCRIQCELIIRLTSGVCVGRQLLNHSDDEIINLHVNLVSTCDSNQSLNRRRLGDAPHLHPRPLLLLPAGAVGAMGGAAVERHDQADGGQDENQQQHHRHQADGQ